jgi:hypothetical protein
VQLAAELRPATAEPRRARLWALAGLVLLGHLWLVETQWPDRLGAGAADAPRRRIEVAFVRELAPAAPPAQPPAVAAPPRRLTPRAPERAASAAVEDAVEPPPVL